MEDAGDLVTLAYLHLSANESALMSNVIHSIHHKLSNDQLQSQAMVKTTTYIRVHDSSDKILVVNPRSMLTTREAEGYHVPLVPTFSNTAESPVGLDTCLMINTDAIALKSQGCISAELGDVLRLGAQPA
jgi:hypothetical protein